jgi:hypothetical protein
MNDYIPRSYENQADWLKKQQDDLTPQLATTVSMSTTERDDFLGHVGILHSSAAEIVALMQQLEQKTADHEALLAQHLPAIRAGVKRAKTSAGCTPGIQEQLEWVGDETTFDPATARPTITVEAQRGRVKSMGKKPGFDAVNLYFRKKGEVQWKLIAVRRRKFPIFDEAPLAVAGVPEVREYMAIGVIDDEEIGQPSEIKEVVFVG